MSTKRWLALSIGFAIAMQSSIVFAVLTPAGGQGSGTGWMEHAFGPVGGQVAGGPPAIFNNWYNPGAPFGDLVGGNGDSGGMLQPGFNYPSFGVIPWPAVAENDTGNFPMVANTVYNWGTPAGMGGTTFGGATTSMVGVGGGGKAGVAAKFTLGDNSPPLGQVSTSTFAASVVYNSVGATTTRFGHFLGSNVIVPVGGYAAAGVKSIFEIGDHNPVTGAFTVDSFWEPLPILMVFDGAAGPLADVIQAQFFNFLAAGQTLSFGALSTTPLTLIPNGKSVRMRSTVTLVADPDATMVDIPLNSFFDVFTELDLGGPLLGFGASTDAVSALSIPEPTAFWTLSVACVVSLGLGWCYRKLTGRKPAEA